MPFSHERIVMTNEDLEFMDKLTVSVRHYCINHQLDTLPHDEYYYYDLVKTLYWEMSVKLTTDTLEYDRIVSLMARQIF